MVRAQGFWRGWKSIVAAFGRMSAPPSMRRYAQERRQFASGVWGIPAQTLEERALLVAAAPFKLDGIAFSPYVAAGEDPTTGQSGQATPNELQERLAAIMPYTNWVTVFADQPDFQQVSPLAHSLGLQVAVVANLKGVDAQADQAQINAAVAQAVEGNANLVILGQETLLKGTLTAQQLIDYINAAKSTLSNAGKSTPVATADRWSKLLANTNVMNASDVVLATFDPFREGVAVDNAIAGMRQQLVQLTAAAGRRIWIASTGWPTGGTADPNLPNAIPSAANAAKYLQNVVSLARSEKIPVSVFAAFDEPWRATSGMSYDAFWGLATSQLSVKSENSSIFQGTTATYDWATPPVGVRDLDGPWVTSSGNLAQVMQSGTSLTFVNGGGGTSAGVFENGGGQVTATGWTVTGDLDLTVADTGRILWNNGSTWIRLNAGGQYVGSKGKLTSITQRGFSLLFTNADGATSTGTWVNANTFYADAWQITGTFTRDGTITWSNSNAWRRLSLATEYVNPTGDAVRIIDNSTTALTFVNKLGGTSPGNWINPTQVTATAWNQVGTVANGLIQWSNGTAWKKKLTIEGISNGGTVRIAETHVGLTLTNKQGGQSTARITGANTIFAVQWNVTGTRVNGKIVWSNSTTWNHFDLNALDAVFSDITTYPFGA
ncbi:MAG: glycosyl hydrolase family 17 protein [Planctomycetales bacterium]